MSQSKWLFYNDSKEIVENDIKNNYVKSLFVNPTDFASMKITCFDTCTNQADGFSYKSQCMSNCVNLATLYLKPNLETVKIPITNQKK